jgi:hypothetical protein
MKHKRLIADGALLAVIVVAYAAFYLFALMPSTGAVGA